MSIDVLAERGIKTAVPEGWGFFTRNPREPDITLYENHGGHWRKAEHMPISSASNLSGIDRLPRAQSVELGMLLNALNESDAWTPCDGDLESCLKGVRQVSLHPQWRYPALRGLVAFIRQEPVPWAWVESRATIRMPIELIVANLE